MKTLCVLVALCVFTHYAQSRTAEDLKNTRKHLEAWAKRLERSKAEVDSMFGKSVFETIKGWVQDKSKDGDGGRREIENIREELKSISLDVEETRIFIEHVEDLNKRATDLGAIERVKEGSRRQAKRVEEYERSTDSFAIAVESQQELVKIVKEKVSDVLAKAGRLQEAVKRQSSVIDARNKELGEMDTQIKQLEEKENEYLRRKSQIEDKINALRGSNAAMKTTISDLEGLLKNIEDNIANLKKGDVVSESANLVDFIRSFKTATATGKVIKLSLTSD